MLVTRRQLAPLAVNLRDFALSHVCAVSRSICILELLLPVEHPSWRRGSNPPGIEISVAGDNDCGPAWEWYDLACGGVGRERESKESREFSLRPSLLQFQGTSSPHSTCELNDVALFHMQGQQYAEDDSLSGLSSSLECGLVSTTSVQVKEQQKEEPGRSRLQIDRKVSQEADAWAVFPDKLPWISSTPATRANNRKVEVGISMEKPLGMPPQPILPPAPSVEAPVGLTAEEERMLQHLKGIQSMDMELTESMARKLEELSMREAKVQSNKTLTHGHLNKLNKLKSQVATAAQKIKDLDGEWTAFVNNTINKVRHHGEMFQNCRADLMETYNAKIQELAAVKQETTKASQSMLGSQWTEPIIPEAPDLEQHFTMLQETLQVEGHAGQIDLTEEMEDEELLEEEGHDKDSHGKLIPKAMRPFRGSSSPTKVATHHLKVKAQEVKDAKENRKERDKEDK